MAAASGPGPYPPEQGIAGFLEYWEKVRARTLRVARVVPADRLEWRPVPSLFSFGDLLRHLAGIERHLYAENARLSHSTYPGHGAELAEGYDAVFAYVERLHGEAMAIFGSLTDADLQRKCHTPDGTPITTWKWLRAMIEHEVHHRGQIYTGLGMLGIAAPPLFGLTSEQVRERSRPL